MLFLPAIAAAAASFGWAAGIVLAQQPARALGAFEFTRIQLIACGAILGILCTVLGLWQSVSWSYWPAFVVSICFGIILGNLAMIECLRRGGARNTELLLSLKAPIVAGIAFIWLGETLTIFDLIGSVVALFGVSLAIMYGANNSAGSNEVRGHVGVVIALGLSAALFQGFGFLIVKPAMVAGAEPIAISAIRLLGAAFIISVIALWPAKSLQANCELTPSLLGRTVLAGLIGYGFSSSLLLYAFANYNAGVVTVLGSLSPILVLFILWIKDGEKPRAQSVLGAALAIVGASIIVHGG